MAASTGKVEAEVLSGLNNFESFISKKRLNLILFMEEWSESSVGAKESLRELLEDPEVPKNIGFGTVLAEAEAEISATLDITGVPTTVLFVDGKETFRLTGLRMRDLIEKLDFYAAQPPQTVVPTPVSEDVQESEEDLKLRLEKLVNQDKIMLFMKGNPEQPQCGFSRTIVQILKDTGLPYSTFNILADNEVREGLKSYSNWRTYPQLYVKGQLIGGLDIVKELKEAGELESTLEG